MDFIFEYGMFLAKTLTIVAGIGFFIISIITASQRLKKQDKQGHIEIKALNISFRKSITKRNQVGLATGGATLCNYYTTHNYHNYRVEKLDLLSHNH